MRQQQGFQGNFMAAPFASVPQGLLFAAAYVALDWTSYVYPLHGLNITPWNPALPLGLVYWLHVGKSAAIPWFISLLVGEILVRGLPVTLPATFALAAILTASYGMLGEVLRRHLEAGHILYEQRGLFSWLLVVAVGTLATSSLYITALVLFQALPQAEWPLALLRFWVGDCVGVIVTLPFCLMLVERRGRTLLAEILPRWETAGYGTVAVLMLWMLFQFGGEDDLHYFFLLYLPLVWAAARQGAAGAAVSAFLLQAGIMIGAHWMSLGAETVLELQMLAAILAFVGLFIGTEVDEKQRISNELRQTLHLAAAGEMAAAVAHELNQPLTALTAYGTASAHLMAEGDTGERLAASIRGMVAESYRAAEVVRRLRDFFWNGTTRLEPVALGTLIDATVASFAARAPAEGVRLIIDPAPPWTLLVDPMQIQVVLRNLLANAFDAVASQPSGHRWVRLSSRATGARRFELWVEDSGPGVPEPLAQQLFDTFFTTKASGMGLGLTISRAIAMAHGGDLTVEAGDRALFKLSLPREDASHDNERLPDFPG